MEPNTMETHTPNGVSLFGTNLFGDPVKPKAAAATAPLAGEFIAPPFSVLDARAGLWQERKAAWIALGIESELGRGTDIVPNGTRRGASHDGCYERGYGKLENNRDPGRSNGQDLMKGENKNFGVIGGQAAAPDRQNGTSGTSIFDPVLTELCYTWFAPPGGMILDPFAGGSVRGLLASLLGYRYHGIELRPEQVRANEIQAGRICAETAPPTWITGDAREHVAAAPPADFLFTCPPYGDLERYSDDPADLSTMEYDTFLACLYEIVYKSCLRLKDNRFAGIVVGDFRDRKAGTYRGLVSHTQQIFRKAGLELYNDAVLLTAVGSLPVRVGKQFRAGRKLGKTHQNVLIFVKGDWRKAAAACNQ